MPSETVETEPTQRDRYLQPIAAHGCMAWQTASGYTRRANEVDIAVHVLNRMLEHGCPNSVRIA